MKASEQKRSDGFYRRHLRALKLRGLSDNTIDVSKDGIRCLTCIAR